MKDIGELQKELGNLGLLEKARDIFHELGEPAVVSFVRSSYRLLSKVYHPDLNPGSLVEAGKTQRRLNRVAHLMRQMTDKDIVESVTRGSRSGVKEKKKILVVEDESNLLEMFRDILLMEGYEVREGIDGENGYEVFCQFGPDLVLTDVLMPGINGFELARRVRRIDRGVKFVFISGFWGIMTRTREDRENIIKHGYRTLSKPCRASDILELVKDYLNEEAKISVFA